MRGGRIFFGRLREASGSKGGPDFFHEVKGGTRIFPLFLEGGGPEFSPICQSGDRIFFTFVRGANFFMAVKGETRKNVNGSSQIDGPPPRKKWLMFNSC